MNLHRFLGNYQYAKDVLDALDHQRANIYHWNRRGGFARQYVELLSTFDKIHHGQVRSLFIFIRKTVSLCV